MAQWYYKKNDEAHGPVSPKELKRLADAGDIIGTDLVRNESTEKWVKASSVKGLIRIVEPKVSIPKPTVAVAEKSLSGSKNAGKNNVGTPRRSLLQSVFVIASFLFCCFPIGLVLVWNNSNWKTNTKLAWTGATLTALFLLALLGQYSESQSLKRLVEAHKQWDNGNQDAAISVYRNVTRYGPLSVPKSERAIVYGRLIESEIEHGMDQSAREYAEASVSYGFEPSLSSAGAKSLLHEIQEEQRLNASRSTANANRNIHAPERSDSDHKANMPWLITDIAPLTSDAQETIMVSEARKLSDLDGEVPNQTLVGLQKTSPTTITAFYGKNPEYDEVKEVTMIEYGFDLKETSMRKSKIESLDATIRRASQYRHPFEATTVKSDTVIMNYKTGSEVCRVSDRAVVIENDSLTFSPSGESFLLVTNKSMAHIRTADGKVLWEKTPEAMVSCVAFSADEKQILTGHTYYHATVQIWNATTGEPAGLFAGHRLHDNPSQTFVTSIGILNDGQTVVSSGYRGVTCVWKLSDQSELYTLQNAGGLVADLDGKRAILGRSVWELPELKPASAVAAPGPGPGPRITIENVSGTKFAFASDSRSLAALISGNGVPVVFDIARGKQLSSLISDSDVRALAMGSGGALGFEPDLAGSLSFRAELVSSPERVGDLREMLEGPPAMNRMCPNGPLCVSVGNDTPLSIRDLRTGRNLVRLAAVGSDADFSSGLRSVYFSNDQQWLAVNGIYGDTAVWNLKSGESVWSKTKEINLEARGFGSSKYFALIASDNSLSTINLTTGSESCTVDFPYGTTFCGFSSDGESFLLMLNDGPRRTLEMKNSADGVTTRRLTLANLQSAIIQADRYAICWESNPDRCVVRDLKDESVVRTLGFGAEQSPVRTLTISASGRYVATLHDNKKLHVWDFADTDDNLLAVEVPTEIEPSSSDRPSPGERLQLVALTALASVNEISAAEQRPISPPELNEYMRASARVLNAQEFVDISPSSDTEKYSQGKKLRYIKYGDGVPRIEFGFIEAKGEWVLLTCWLADKQWNPLTGFSK